MYMYVYVIFIYSFLSKHDTKYPISAQINHIAFLYKHKKYKKYGNFLFHFHEFSFIFFSFFETLFHLTYQAYIIIFMNMYVPL